MIIKFNSKLLVFSKKIQHLCACPYYGHPRGCPNFGLKFGCPPDSPLIDSVLNMTKGLYLIWTEFNIGEFARRMKQRHPKWSIRQRHNCRLWQPAARKQHRDELRKVMKQYRVKVVSTPEAHGVNVTSLMKQVACIDLEWPPRNITRIVSLGGIKRGFRI